MQVIFKNIKEDFKQYNKISKYILKMGTVILILMVILAIILKAVLLFSSPEISLKILYDDLLECIKESFGAIYFGSLFLEILNRILQRKNLINS